MGELRMEIDSRLSDVKLVGTALFGMVLRETDDSLLASEIETCVVEAVTNAIVHAYGGEEGHVVGVRVVLEGDRLDIRVEDIGTPMEGEMDIRPLAFNVEDPATFPEGGMGLYLMGMVMDRVRYRSENGRNEIRLEKRLSRKDDT